MTSEELKKIEEDAYQEELRRQAEETGKNRANAKNAEPKYLEKFKRFWGSLRGGDEGLTTCQLEPLIGELRSYSEYEEALNKEIWG